MQITQKMKTVYEFEEHEYRALKKCVEYAYHRMTTEPESGINYAFKDKRDLERLNKEFKKS